MEVRCELETDNSLAVSKIHEESKLILSTSVSKSPFLKPKRNSRSLVHGLMLVSPHPLFLLIPLRFLRLLPDPQAKACNCCGKFTRL